MTSYLAGGWFQSTGQKGLRTEVVDGAMDVAGLLSRAEVPAHVLMRVALRVRALVAIADPQMVGVNQFSSRERERVQKRLEKYTDISPELHAFVADCLDRVNNVGDMMAFYLHLIHVARMMQLLDVALHDTLMAAVVNSESRRAGVAAESRSPEGKSEKKPRKKKTGKAATKKKRAKKKTGRAVTKKKTGKTAAKKKLAKKKTSKTAAKKKLTEKKTSKAATKKKTAKKKTGKTATPARRKK